MKNLSKIRLEKNLSQSDIAKSLHVARNTVSQWENSKREPDCNTLIKLAKFLNVTTDELLGNDNNNKNLFIPESKRELIRFLVDMPISAEHEELIRLAVQLNSINLLKATCYTAGLLTSQN